jgi:hypothetical protein
MNEMEFTCSCLLNAEIGGGRGLFSQPIHLIEAARDDDLSSDQSPDGAVSEGKNVAEQPRMSHYKR